jgi:thaumarchaeosortase
VPGLTLQNKTYHMATLLKVLPLIAFAAPLAILYIVNPFDASLNISAQASFELMWKGRTFQLFFIWLIALELILGWENISSKINLQNKPQLAAYGIALALPSVYVLAEFAGLNGALASWCSQTGVAFFASMPLAIEYLAFSAMFLLLAFLSYGKKGLADFALPAIFAVLVGVIYTIDNVFPYGEFTPFQLLVPTTASLAGGVLGLMGYAVVPGVEAATGMPTLQVTGAAGSATFAIAWPCAGIESLLIFTAVALLFLKQMNISWKAKLGFFAFGAAITYLINILRITEIFVIGSQYGEYSDQVNAFHYYYGPLYAMAWIVAYPLLIMAATMGYQKFKKKPQQAPLNPA